VGVQRGDNPLALGPGEGGSPQRLYKKRTREARGVFGGASLALPKKRMMSAAAKERIAAGARARWARIKGTAAPTTQPKKKMSAAAKARLSAIARARWKRARAAGRTAL